LALHFECALSSSITHLPTLVCGQVAGTLRLRTLDCKGVSTSENVRAAFGNVQEKRLLRNASAARCRHRSQKCSGFGVPKHSELEPDNNLAARDGNPTESSRVPSRPKFLLTTASRKTIPYFIGIVINRLVRGVMFRPTVKINAWETPSF